MSQPKICGVSLEKDPSRKCPYPAKYNGKCGIHDKTHAVISRPYKKPSECHKKVQDACMSPNCEWLKERTNKHGVHTKAYCRKPVFEKSTTPKSYRRIFKNPSSKCKGMIKPQCDQHLDECVWTHDSVERSYKYPLLPKRMAHCRKKPSPPLIN